MADASSPINPQPPQWVGESSEIEMAPEVHILTVSEFIGAKQTLKEGNFPHAQDDVAPPVDTLLPSHSQSAQASEDSVVLNLDGALSKAYEEIAELRGRVLELETDASELLKSHLPQGKLL